MRSPSGDFLDWTAILFFLPKRERKPEPVDLMRRPVLNHTQHGEPIYDPFLGSGTTLVAAEQNQRICFGMDIDARYVDVAVRRWEQFTGHQAQLAEKGETFEQVRESRQR